MIPTIQMRNYHGEVEIVPSSRCETLEVGGIIFLDGDHTILFEFPCHRSAMLGHSRASGSLCEVLKLAQSYSSSFGLIFCLLSTFSRTHLSYGSTIITILGSTLVSIIQNDDE